MSGVLTGDMYFLDRHKGEGEHPAELECPKDSVFMYIKEREKSMSEQCSCIGCMTPVQVFLYEDTLVDVYFAYEKLLPL